MQFERPLVHTVIGIWDSEREGIFQVGVKVNGRTKLLPVFWTLSSICVTEHDGVDSWI